MHQFRERIRKGKIGNENEKIRQRLPAGVSRRAECDVLRYRPFHGKSVLTALGTAVAGTGLVQAFNNMTENKSKSDKMKHVEPCRACNRCGMDGTCIFNDDFLELRPKLIEADMVVFATPMYYFGVSAQMKRVIDRFYAINGQIKGAPKKAAFLMTYADTAAREAEPMLVHYRMLMDYLGWTSVGEVVAPGVWTAGSVRNTDYTQQAYLLGRNMR